MGERWFFVGSCHTSGTEVEDEPDDRRADHCRKCEAHHEHAIPLEVALESKRHLDESIDDEHPECQILRFARDHKLHELGQHRADVHKTEEPDDLGPADSLREFFSGHVTLFL